MHDGSRGPVYSQVALVIVSLFSIFGASSQLGSNVATPIPSPGSPGCYLDDRCTLLTFRRELLNEGNPALASWSNADVNQWKGVTWKTAADGTSYVEKLELGYFQLNGTGIAPLLQSGLTNMTTLNISGNFISATLPDPLRVCPALLVLDISNNSFGGRLPKVLSCGDFNGSAALNPIAFASTNLRVFNVSMNNFLGEVPGSLFSSVSSGGGGSLGNLTSLVLERNGFNGSFPSSIGNCSDLVELKLSFNNFGGPFPFGAIQTLQKLEILDAANNSITGELLIPNDGGIYGQLKSFNLGYNLLTGIIPESFGNLSNLELLELKDNHLSGTIPTTLAKLSQLRILSLQNNSLIGSIPEEFSQLSNLATLSLNDNQLRGSLSASLSNCTSLQSIWLNRNSLSGVIPPELGNLPSLVVLSLFGNYFNQSIPKELGRVKTLVAFDLSYNNLDGTIPDGLCELYQLQVLLINNNLLTGPIPHCFGNYTYIRLLDLSNNLLSGYLPDDLSNLSMNVQPVSKAPDQLSSATYNEELNGQNLVFHFSESPISYSFFNNFLSGRIPSSLGSIQRLQQLSLSNNSLSGSIPEALGNASSLLALDLSYNNLSGIIPFRLTRLHFLSRLNFSYNNLSGQIPQASQFLTFTKSSFFGNPLLCGFPLSKCSPFDAPTSSSQESSGRSVAKKLLPLYITLGSAFLCVCFLGGLFAWSWIRGSSRKNSSLVSNDGDVYENKGDLQFFQVTISSVLPRLSPKELALATENYNENNIIGDGGFGLVYKAVLSCGSVVAVKKLLEDGAQGQNEFLAEMRTLGKIKHKNLVALLGYCAYGKERILVYEYMKNGSLDAWLHCRDEGMASLDWRTRLKVARGAAEGLAFLHHGSDPTIIHRDIKASNILLDGNFEARLADFGLARSTRAFESHVSTDFAGTAGYIPPEYSQATAATTKGDVYSFGVVLLEILTGRRPTDPFFRKNEMSHVATWILDISMEEAIEKTLDMTSAASTDEMLEMMRIACLCCQDVPSKRPNMGHVVRMLDALERQQSPSRSPSVVPYDDAMSSPRCR